MKIFLDTASVSELKEGVAMGILDGCTTNPSLIAKEKRPFRPLVEEICSIVPGPVSLEVVATDFEGMVKEGKELAQIAPNVVVKCPLTKDGLKAVKRLTGEGIKVNQTLCFSASQALLSAKAGATYISPFLGRLDDISHLGMDLSRQIRSIYANSGSRAGEGGGGQVKVRGVSARHGDRGCLHGGAALSALPPVRDGDAGGGDGQRHVN